MSQMTRNPNDNPETWKGVERTYEPETRPAPTGVQNELTEWKRKNVERELAETRPAPPELAQAQMREILGIVANSVCKCSLCVFVRNFALKPAEPEPETRPEAQPP